MPRRMSLRHIGLCVDLEENAQFKDQIKLATILEDPHEDENPRPTIAQPRDQSMARKAKKPAAKGEAGKPKDSAKDTSSRDHNADRGDGKAPKDNTKLPQQPLALTTGQAGGAGPSTRQPSPEHAPSGEFNAAEVAAYMRQEILPPPMAYRSTTRPLLPDGRPVPTFADRSTVMANGREFFGEFDRQARKLAETGGAHEGG